MINYIEIHSQDDFNDRPRNDHLCIFDWLHVDQSDINIIGNAMETWDVSNWRHMCIVFATCTNIPRGICNWDVSGCLNANGIFRRCRYVPNISAWHFSECRDIGYMFKRCFKLNQPLSFCIKKCSVDDGIFKNCYSLKY